MLLCLSRILCGLCIPRREFGSIILGNREVSEYQVEGGEAQDDVGGLAMVVEGPAEGPDVAVGAALGAAVDVAAATYWLIAGWWLRVC
jgi:hypothetical protein